MRTPATRKAQVGDVFPLALTDGEIAFAAHHDERIARMRIGFAEKDGQQVETVRCGIRRQFDPRGCGGSAHQIHQGNQLTGNTRRYAAGPAHDERNPVPSLPQLRFPAPVLAVGLMAILILEV